MTTGPGCGTVTATDTAVAAGTAVVSAGRTVCGEALARSAAVRYYRVVVTVGLADVPEPGRWDNRAVEIRPLDPADRADAVALWHRAGLTRPWNPPEQDFDRAVTGPSSTVLGGFEDGRLAATAMVGHDGHRCWVYYAAVDPDRQATGLGRAMMEAAEAWARAAALPKIQLMVRSSNTGTLGFYDSLGYTVEDTVVLSRWLEQS